MKSLLLLLTFLSAINIVIGQTKTSSLAVTSGTHILIKKDTFIIKSINYDNNVKQRFDTPNSPTEEEYNDIKRLGFNTIKLLMSYQDFEKKGVEGEYKKKGWDWIDSHISLAKKHQIKLILSLYTPPGGHQSSEASDELWLNTGFQLRLIRLWYNISLRYKNESLIIAYDILDAPSPKYSISQWKQLAKNVVDDLRNNGDQHIVILHNCVFTAGSTAKKSPEKFNFPVLKNQPNIIYAFDYWNDRAFTQQHIKGLPYFNNNETYPNQQEFTFPNDLVTTRTTDDNTRIGKGTNEFSFTEGKKYLVNDSNTVSILPVIYSNNLMPGFAFYNTIIVKEFSPTGRYIRDIMLADPNKVEGWEIDSEDPDAKFKLIPDYGMSLVSVIRIDRVNKPTRIFNTCMRFKPKFGYYYSVGAHTLTKSINFEGESYLRLEFEKSATNKVPTPRTKEGIETELNYYTEWSKQNNLPIMISSFGSSEYSFKRKRGGDTYLKDVINITLQQKINYSFNSYNGRYFGLYSIDKNGQLTPRKPQLNVWED
ncbi:glycoside hydrolase family 5 protein [Cyclobacteriaceae bacterium]|nr:glycoside hydrolase family 5 protein [Cyclobacteriaceae bacterium]